jgi:hypothetical protein
MSSGRMPAASEILDVMDRLERDPERRQQLTSGYDIFRACVSEGVVGGDSIDWLAQRMQELHSEGLLVHGPISVGVLEPIVWDGAWLQSAHNWRVTASGRADADLFRRASAPVSDVEDRSDSSHDLFISHAGEDKESVARPLARALQSRGWSVWLDELELTIGDSLSGRIDGALAKSRFGVVILSRAFFAKPWPQRELAGLAAREVVAGTKVILPVWHEIDQLYISERSPTLADRLGAATSLGIDEVAVKLSEALERAGMQASHVAHTESIVQAVEAGPPQRLIIPTSAAERAKLADEHAELWEHLVHVGVLVQGKQECETKWHDHELRIGRGSRREVIGPSAFSFLGREIGWMSKQIAVLNRVFDPALQERAFGRPGEHGDIKLIENLARRIIALYEALMDWAALLRNTSVSSELEDILETTACFADAPLMQVRDFIDHAADQLSRVPELRAGASEANPLVLNLSLTLAVDTTVHDRYYEHLAVAEKAFVD